MPKVVKEYPAPAKAPKQNAAGRRRVFVRPIDPRAEVPLFAAAVFLAGRLGDGTFRRPREVSGRLLGAAMLLGGPLGDGTFRCPADVSRRLLDCCRTMRLLTPQ